MKTQILRLGDKELSEVSVSEFLTPKTQKDPKRSRMVKILKIAFVQELTERQRECISLYYIKNRKVKEIADMLSIRPTTVYKHIRKGILSLRKAAVYL